MRRPGRKGGWPVAVGQPWRGAICAFVLAVSLAAAAPASAQSLTGAFDQLQVGPDEPIRIESDTLVVRRKQRTAVFEGNVEAVRGPIHMSTARLTVEYEETGKGTGRSRTEITKLDARGAVRVTSRNQSATGEWAVMDVREGKITLGGKVVLRQGDTVIEGSRLDIDLDSGRSRLVGQPASGGRRRVRGVFMPGRRN